MYLGACTPAVLSHVKNVSPSFSWAIGRASQPIDRLNVIVSHLSIYSSLLLVRILYLCMLSAYKAYKVSSVALFQCFFLFKIH